MKIATILLLGALLGSQARADVHCGMQSHALFNFVASVDATPLAKAQMLDGTCDELESAGWTAAPSPVDVFYGGAVKTSLALIGLGLARTDTLDGSPQQRHYMQALLQIAKLTNPIERIRQVYELAAQVSGHYDSETFGRENFLKGFGIFALTPSRLIDSANENGSAGVCREFSALLRWSLAKVAFDYQTEVIAGKDDRGLGHVWVRVHLPAHSIDLDTVFYQNTFTPLFPRHQGYSGESLVPLKAECRRIQKCLLDL